jgi:hypothetical protein
VSAESHRDVLEAAAARLEEISRSLASPETDDATAVALAREAAEIAAEVGTVAAEAARVASESGESA